MLHGRREAVNRVPDRLSDDPENASYDRLAVDRGVRVFVNDKERHGVTEFRLSEGWVRIQTPSRDRLGRRILLTVRGTVRASFDDADPKPASSASRNGS